MYVCVCHGLNEKSVAEAIGGGASSAGKVFKHHGLKVECGKCCHEIRSMIKDCSEHCARRTGSGK